MGKEAKALQRFPLEPEAGGGWLVGKWEHVFPADEIAKGGVQLLCKTA